MTKPRFHIICQVDHYGPCENSKKDVIGHVIDLNSGRMLRFKPPYRNGPNKSHDKKFRLKGASHFDSQTGSLQGNECFAVRGNPYGIFGDLIRDTTGIDPLTTSLTVSQPTSGELQGTTNVN